MLCTGLAATAYGSYRGEYDGKTRCIKPALALAVHRRALVRRIGLLTTLGWAQHIVDRWRDAVSNRPVAPADIELTADEFLSDNPHRGGYHGMHVPGA